MSALGQERTNRPGAKMRLCPLGSKSGKRKRGWVVRFVPIGDIHTLKLRCALAQLLDCGDNAPKLTGDGFGDNFERWIPDLLHGYGRVDGGDFDLAASEVLHDHVAR